MNYVTDIVYKLLKPKKSGLFKPIPYQVYATELSWLLGLKFLPLMVEMENQWEHVFSYTESEQLTYYQTALDTLSQSDDPVIRGIYTQAITQLSSPQLTTLAEMLTQLPLLSTDDLGEIYERFIEKCHYEDKQNFHVIVPQALVDMMVIVTQPRYKEIIQDPHAGIGNFLIATDQYLRVTTENLSFSEQWSFQSHVSGMETNLTLQRFALVNCAFHHIFTAKTLPVTQENSLLSNQQMADVIFCNLLFAAEQAENLNRTLAILQYLNQYLNSGGRAAFIVTDEILQAGGLAQKMRKNLLDQCVVHTVLRLPQGCFYPHDIAAHVLFLYKNSASEITEKIWFYDLRQGMPSFSQYLRLTRDDLVEFENAYGNDPFGKERQCFPEEDEAAYCYWINRTELEQDRLDFRASATEEENTFEIWKALDTSVEELETVTTLLNK